MDALPIQSRRASGPLHWAGEAAQTANPPESVTIVVTDIAGFTGFSARLGDLAARQVLHRFFTTAEQLVRMSGGRTLKLLGDDGAMILFADTENAFTFATALRVRRRG